MITNGLTTADSSLSDDLFQHWTRYQMNERYQRQTIFEPFGSSGQEALSRSSVLICGCGALGGSVADILVRAGIGAVRLIDPDVVQIDNLHRQFLFSEKDAKQKKFKVDAAFDSLTAANSSVIIEGIVGRFSEENAKKTTQNAFDPSKKVDLIVDGTDNFPSRFLLNEVAVRYGIPFITAGVCGASGQILTIFPGKTPCLACLFDSENPKDSSYLRYPTESAEIFPILAPVVQTIAALEAISAIKILSKRSETVPPRLFSIDLWNNQYKTLDLSAFGSDENCPVCGKR